MLSNPSMGNIGAYDAAADDDDGHGIADEIIRSQQMAWKSAQKRNQQEQEQPSATSNEMMTTYHNQTKLDVPRSQNPTGSDSVHPHKAQMKGDRQVTTAAAATGGALIGAIVTGPAFPVGALIGGAVSGYTANKLHKKGERRAQRKWEQANFQLGVHKAPVSQHTIV